MIAFIPSRLLPTGRPRRLAAVIALACLLLPALAGPSRGGQPEAVAAYERGDYETAARLWLPLAAQGNREALYALGQLYRQGLGVDTNPARAERYYLRAAQRGHVLAQSNLGTMLFFKKPKADRRGALQWWRLAAKGHEPHALYMLGVMNLNGEVVPRDLTTGYAYLLLAEAAGLKEAGDARAKVGDTLDAKILSDARELARRIDAGATAKRPKPIPEPVIRPAARPAATREAAVETAAPTAYLIQLGALGSDDGARELWHRLVRGQGALFGDLSPHVERFERAAGKPPLYRLRAGPFATSDAARRRCDALKARKISCYVAKTQ